MPYLTGYAGQMNPAVAATIASGQTKSSVINLNGFTPVGVLLPATFTGTALTFEASIDGTNFFPLRAGTGGSALSYTVAQGTYAALDPKDFYGVQYLKLVSGSTEGAARTLNLAVKGF